MNLEEELGGSNWNMMSSERKKNGSIIKYARHTAIRPGDNSDPPDQLVTLEEKPHFCKSKRTSNKRDGIGFAPPS